MARQSKYVKVIMSHEKRAMEMLWRTGVCTRVQLKEHFAISADRLKKLVNSGYMKDVYGKVVLDDKGVKHMKKLGMEHRYRTSLKNAGHDMKLTKQYLAIPEQYRESWKTEAQLRYEAMKSPNYEAFKQRMEALHPNGKMQATPDAAVYSPSVGGYVAIEITTQNYKDIDIEQKMEFANEFLSGYYQL